MAQELMGGATYIVREQKGEASFQLFAKLTSKGKRGLCITRKHPEIVKSRYHLPPTLPLRWLTPSLGRDRVDPKALNTLTSVVYHFATGNPGAVILLDGMEYILLHNEFSKALLFLENLNDFVMQTDAVLLVPINPEAMDAHNLALMERNAEVLEGSQLVSRQKVEHFVKLIDRYMQR